MNVDSVLTTSLFTQIADRKLQFSYLNYLERNGTL